MLVELFETEVDVLEPILGRTFVVDLALHGLQVICSRLERGQCVRNFLADILQAVPDQLFYQVLAEAFPGSGKILLAKIERLADDGFANRNARSRFTLDVDIRLMIQNAADLVSGAVAVGRFDDDLAAALKDVRNKLVLIIGVLNFLAEWNAERVAKAFKHRGLAAPLNANQAVQIGGKGDADAVKQAAFKSDSVNMRVLDLGNPGGNPVFEIRQREADRIESEVADFEVTIWALADFVQRLRIASFHSAG